MGSIIRELDNRTNLHPDKLMFAFLNIKGEITASYTYLEFQYRTDSIAGYINDNYSFKAGDRIILAYPPGLETICAFFACVKLGLIPVPVYPPSAQGFQASVTKMNFIAEDCTAVGILSNSTYFWSIKIHLTRAEMQRQYIAELPWILSDEANYNGVTSYARAHTDILFLQYTSGSTNNPKGVIVTHDNIIYNCYSVVDHDPIGVSWLPQYHDMGLIGYYLNFAIMGGTTYGFSPAHFIQKPALWLETISKYSATASSAPNFAYEYCLLPGRIPEETLATLDLRSLSFLMTAAEPINTNIYKAFLEKFQPYGLEPGSFFAAYGLAEFSLAVSNRGNKIQYFDADALKKNEVKVINSQNSDEHISALISCGKPLRDTEVKIVDISSDPIELPDNKVGEIWLKGTSKCLAYWNKPDLTRQIFQATLKGNNNETFWLRTGDLGFMRDGEIYICGRAKDMIIIRGLNYYPQDIEILVEEDPQVRKGCVAAFAVEEDNHESLIIVVGVKNKRKLPDYRSINNRITGFTGITARQFVFVPARTVAKTSSGKIKRYENKRRFLCNELEVIESVNIDQAEIAEVVEPQVGSNGKSTKQTSEIFHLFNKYRLTGKESEPLMDSGLDSIKLAEFAHDIKAFMKREGYQDLSEDIDLGLLQKIAVSELYGMLTGLLRESFYSRFKFKKVFARIQKEHQHIEQEMMKRDAGNLLAFPKPKERIKADDSSGDILLTGGTGFFGPFILKSLLEQNKEDIYVLVRAENPDKGMERLRQAFTLLNVSASLKAAFENRIKPVCGDISLPQLGLKKEEWSFLSENIHTIYHNGALVNYLFDYESMRSANVGGTRQIVRLAFNERPKILNHISTTFIFGWSVKDTLFENDANDAMEHLDFGYSQSKWVSEMVVKNAMNNGLEARIFRPALIAPSIEGEGFNFDISIRLLAFMLGNGIGTSARNQVSFTPADIAANNIIAISNLKESIGKTFHVTRDTYSSMGDVTDIFTQLTGQSFKMFPLSEFVPEVVSRCKKEDLLFPLLNFLVRSEEKIRSMEFKLYDNSNYRKFRDRTPFGQKDKSLEQVVAGILKFMQSQGILKMENHG